MARKLTQTLKKLQAYESNPDVFSELSSNELAGLVVHVMGAFSSLEKKIAKDIADGRYDAYQPVAGKDYEPREAVLKAFQAYSSETTAVLDKKLSELDNELNKAIREVVESIQDGEDGFVTDEDIKEAAEIASGLIELPDFEALIDERITASPILVRDSLELLQGDERLEQTAIKGLEDTVKKIYEEIARNRTSGGGAGTSVHVIRRVINEAIADGTIGSGGASVSDDAYSVGWDGDTTTAPSKNAIYDKIETLPGGHDPVTVTDSSEIDFTLTGQDITATLKAGSIDETKLDTSVNASLDKADSALQPGDKTGTDANVVSGTAGTDGNLSKWNTDGDLVDTVIKEVRAVNSLSSGLVEGGIISINGGDASKFDVSAGHGVIIDNTTDPDAPVIYNVTWTAFSAQTVTNLATQDTTHILMDNAGAIFQSASAPTATQRRAYIYLGRLGHTNNTTIGAANPSPDLLSSPVNQMRDLEDAVGIINSGNTISANGANLSIDKAVGSIFFNGINFATDPTAPSNRTYAAATPVTFRHRTQTGNGANSQTLLDVANYDNAGTITAHTGTKAQNMRVFLTSGGNVVVQYGQTSYANLAAAIQGLSSESFVVFGNLGEDAALIGIISVLSTATDLTDTSKAKFFTTSKFGEVGSGSSGTPTGTLQTGYNNSIEPEILTNSTLGALTVKRGSATDTDNIIEGKNAADTTTFAVTGNGKVTSETLTASRAVVSGTGKALESSATTSTELGYVSGVTSAIQTQLDAKLASSTYEDATAAETNTGTSTAKYVSPDGLAGSYAGTKSVQVDIFGALATGDGQAKILIPPDVDGMDLISIEASVKTAGTTGTLDIQIRNATDAVDVLSTKLTIDSAETKSTTAATAAVINTANDNAATSDDWYIDIDAVQTTAPEDLSVRLTFRLP